MIDIGDTSIPMSTGSVGLLYSIEYKHDYSLQGTGINVYSLHAGLNDNNNAQQFMGFNYGTIPCEHNGVQIIGFGFKCRK